MEENKNEIFPIVDEAGRVIGQASRGHCHDGSKLLHPVVHLHVFNTKGELFLQRRPDWKDIQPGRWDTACGGHVDFGERRSDTGGLGGIGPSSYGLPARICDQLYL